MGKHLRLQIVYSLFCSVTALTSARFDFAD